ncbi:MAG TPA: Spy/CpxP family protein refolding chaperone [Pyrinomonadaceae bacterium]
MRQLKFKAVHGALALAGVLLLTGLGFVGLAQDGPRRGFGGGGPRDERGGHRGGGPRGGHVPFLRDLNLTDAQKAQIKQITDSAEASTKELRQRMDALHESEMSALTDGNFNEATVRAAAQERANVQVELEVARARTMSQIFAVLTPEQKTQIAAKRQEFEQRRREHEAQRQNAPDEQ